MRRPRITAKAVRGLRTAASLLRVELDNGGEQIADTDVELTDAEAGLEYIYALCDWYENQKGAK